MDRRILAAGAVILSVVAAPTRLSGEPTTTAAPTRPTTTIPTFKPDPPNPLRIFPHRPGAKFEDIEARDGVTVHLGLTELGLGRSAIVGHDALPPGSHPAGISRYQTLGLVDRYAPVVTDSPGVLLRVPVEVTTFPPATVLCVATAAADGAVLVPYDRAPPSARRTTTTVGVGPRATTTLSLYFPVGVHRGRVYVTCRDTSSLLSALLGTEGRAVWAIDA